SGENIRSRRHRTNAVSGSANDCKPRALRIHEGLRGRRNFDAEVAMDTGNEHLLTELRDGVLVLTMNQPAKLNALSDQMMQGLSSSLHNAATDPNVGAVLLTGAGRSFCSGGDITA